MMNSMSGQSMGGLKGLKAKIKSVREMPAEMPESEGEFPQHEIESSADALLKAEQIKSNKALMNHVNKHLAKKKHAINAIVLRANAPEPGEGTPEEEAKDATEPAGS